MKLPRPRLTYANVVSTLCLFVVLGGSAYAATTLTKNSVGTQHLRKEAVTNAKLSKGVQSALWSTTPGPVGPTEGFAAGEFPSAPPQDSLKEEFSFAEAGKPFAFVGGQFRVYCSDSGSEVETGLFVDGNPLAGSGESIPSEQMLRLSLFGLGPQIAAGKHTLAIGFTCVNGDVADLETAATETNYGAILLGG